MRKHLLPLIIITVFSIIGIKALFHPGLFSAHDIWHQVARFYHYQKAISDGQFPPYWITTLAHGLGYPLFFFSYHLPWLLGLPIFWLTASIPLTIKILFIVAYILSGIFMYFFTNDLLQDRLAATLSAILYLWAPYHFATILVSSAMGTTFVFTFLPVLFWGLLRIYKGNRLRGVMLTSFGFSAIILSHLTSLISILPLLILFFCWCIFQRKHVLLPSVLALVLGLILSAFYLLPAIYYSQFTQVTTGAFSQLYKNNFVNFHQLVYSKWGYGISNNAKDGFMSFQIGIAHWLSVAVATLMLLVHSIKQRFLVALLLTAFWLSAIAMLDVSRQAWDLVSKFITIDYPTMFMLPATFIGSLLGGMTLIPFKKPLKIVVFVFLLTTAIYTNRNHLRVNMYTNFPLSLYIESEPTTNSYDEYLPKGINLPQANKESARVVFPPDVEVKSIFQNTRVLSFSANVPRSTTVSIKQFAFPGVSLYVDQQKSAFVADSLGRISFTAMQGIHNITVRFEETLLIKLSKLATFVCLILLVLWSRHAQKT